MGRLFALSFSLSLSVIPVFSSFFSLSHLWSQHTTPHHTQLICPHTHAHFPLPFPLFCIITFLLLCIFAFAPFPFALLLPLSVQYLCIFYLAFCRYDSPMTHNTKDSFTFFSPLFAIYLFVLMPLLCSRNPLTISFFFFFHSRVSTLLSSANDSVCCSTRLFFISGHCPFTNFSPILIFLQYTQLHKCSDDDEEQMNE